MKMKLILIFSALACFAFAACLEPKKKKTEPQVVESEQVEQKDSTLTDTRDGQEYKIVKIDTQTWMAENLNYASDGSECYNNDPDNCDKYGRLYDWEVALNVCPQGWRLPDKTDWDALVSFAGGEETAAIKLKSVSGWKVRVGGTSGTDEFGFAALPGGYRNKADANALFINEHGRWWSATEYDTVNVVRCAMSFSNDVAFVSNQYKTYLLSVRCIKE
ncbi:MAG: fibrobacter succinogenes major paralogous domain-containing protein [Fibromonadaceae bacterium]|jgi:uncharacterized protein (TIGR02145 family)|nr:fibrobacter succinogenes major paralogous domain-containing protein [Fibromonadaceae bacterium]